MGFFCFVIAVAAATLLAVPGLRKLSPPGRRGYANAALLVFSLLYLSIAVEGVFRYFVIVSDGGGQTLSAKKWVRKYWKPVNEYGFRDIRHTGESLYGRNVIVVLGDSFAAGFGVKDHRDRFSDRLGASLGRSWAVINMGFAGWSTRDEINALMRYPHKPDMVILSYFVNDIEGAAKKFGRRFETGREPFELPLFGPLVENSYSVNYFYWRIARKYGPMRSGYVDFLDGCYGDPRIWGEHLEELSRLVSLSRKYGVRLIVAVFPMLIDVEGTASLSAKVAGVFLDKGVEVIDLAPVFIGRAPSSMIVNSMDGHPNENVHAEVAGYLHDMVTRPWRSSSEAPDPSPARLR